MGTAASTAWVSLDGAGPVWAGREESPAWAAPFLDAAASAHGSAEPMIEAVRALSAQDTAALPFPGEGRTLELWELLASTAAVDLSSARVLEPHLDALAILRQAGMDAPTGLLGVYASESGGVTPTASPTTAGDFQVSGTKPWCSLGAECSAAIVTAQELGAEADGELLEVGRRAFLVDLSHPGVCHGDGVWPALGLASIVSTPLEFEQVPAAPVGGAGWYLTRPGFAWGGIGVAAVWFGGAVHLARTLHRSLVKAQSSGRTPDQVGLAALGRVDRLLSGAAAQLSAAAAAIDSGALIGRAAELASFRLRGAVADLCAEVMDVVGKATGPGPLTADADHARAVVDLQVYIRQHHADRDDAHLGRLLLEDTDAGGEGA